MPEKDEVAFEAPGPGSWSLDTQHFPTPVTRFLGEIWEDSMNPAINGAMARRGALVQISTAVVNGFLYHQASSVGVAPGSSSAPSMENPIVAERVARAQRAIKGELWRSELARWDAEVKTDSIHRNLALAKVDVDALNFDATIEHIRACRANHQEMIGRHHMFTGLAEQRANLFYSRAVEWTGLKLQQLALLMDGASPVSSGFTPELDAVVTAIRNDTDARALLESDLPSPQVLDRLRSHDCAVGQAMTRFLLMDGHRLANSFDISGECLFELPENIVDRISDALENGFVDRSADAREDAEYARTLVPAEHRGEFDRLLAAAREIARLKDERGIYQDVWASGISRTAILGAGRKLVAIGVLSDASHFLEANWAEMQSLLRGSNIVSDAELAERRRNRMSLTWRDAPATLGGPSSPPELPEGLPGDVEEELRAEFVTRANVAAHPESEVPDLSGLTSSPGTYEGRARVAVGDYSFGQIKKGDVLVTSNHSEAYNAVVGRVGAIVADTGGILSHLSILAREMGIPCIVGCKNATVLIPDAGMVRVDGDAGAVTVLG